MASVTTRSRLHRLSKRRSRNLRVARELELLYSPDKDMLELIHVDMNISHVSMRTTASVAVLQRHTTGPLDTSAAVFLSSDGPSDDALLAIEEDFDDEEVEVAYDVVSVPPCRYRTIMDDRYVPSEQAPFPEICSIAASYYRITRLMTDRDDPCRNRVRHDVRQDRQRWDKTVAANTSWRVRLQSCA